MMPSSKLSSQCFFFFTPLTSTFFIKLKKNNAEETSAPNPLFYRLLEPKDITPRLNGRKVKRRETEREKVERRQEEGGVKGDYFFHSSSSSSSHFSKNSKTLFPSGETNKNKNFNT